MKKYGMNQATLLRTAREKKGISQGGMSKVIGGRKPNGQGFSNIERCKAGLPAKHLMAVAKALDLDPMAIIEAKIADYREELMSYVEKKDESVQEL